MTTTIKRWASAVAALCASVALGCILALPAQAATTTYDIAANQIIGQVQTVNLDKGTVALTVKAGSKTSSAGIYSEQSCTLGSRLGSVAASKYQSSTSYVSIPKKGAYYLQLRNTGTQAGQAIITTYGMNTPLNKNAYVYSSTDGSGSYVSYHRVSVSARGSISISLSGVSSSSSSFSIKACNSKKKSLTGGWRSYFQASNGKYIGVKKGTYYIAVKSNTPVYKVKYTFNKVASKVAASKKKAKTLKSGKKTTGIVAAGESANWYKIKNGKKRELKVSCSAKTFAGGDYGGLRATLYKGSKKISTIALNDTYPTGTLRSYSKLPKGTYYLKVSRYDTGSGYYALKLK